MQIVLVRHGATDWNLQGRCQGSTDRDLSDVGIRQAEQIAELLSEQEINAIYSSSLRRAQQTAERISQPHKLPVLIEEDVRELDHGELEGLTFNEIKANYADFLVRWRSEPDRSVRDRACGQAHNCAPRARRRDRSRATADWDS